MPKDKTEETIILNGVHYTFDSNEVLHVTEPPEGFPNEEWITLDQATTEWGVTRGNIRYYYKERGVPKKHIKKQVVMMKPIIHVHAPSLALVKGRRVHDAGKGGKI